MDADKLTLSESKLSSEANWGYAAIFAKLLLLAFLPILLRISEGFVSPNATIFNRFWIGTALLAAWHGRSLLNLRSREDDRPVKPFPGVENFLLLLLAAFFCAAYQLMWAWSLTQTSVANSEVMHSLAPIFTALLGWSFFGQQFDRIFTIGMAIAVTGSICLAANDFSITSDKFVGDGLALLSASFWAVSLLATEKLQTRLSITAIATWNSFLVTLFLIPVFLVTGDEIFPHSLEGWSSVLILGIVVVLNQVLVIYIFSWLTAGLVATILLLAPILTAILASFIFSEALDLFNWLALLLILLGIYITTRSQKAVKT